MGPDLGAVMSEEHRKLIGIPDGHELKHTSSKREQRKGRDTDIDYYDELNGAGEVIASYEVRDSMSIYPPQSTTLTFKKL
jgi:hypothetical protein